MPDPKYRVRLTAKAEQDVATVLAWFRERDAMADAARWLTRLFAAIDTLETMPERCGLAAEAESVGSEIRELHFGRRRATYRVLFDVAGRTVRILHIRHSAQDRLSRDDW